MHLLPELGKRKGDFHKELVANHRKIEQTGEVEKSIEVKLFQRKNIMVITMSIILFYFSLSLQSIVAMGYIVYLI